MVCGAEEPREKGAKEKGEGGGAMATTREGEEEAERKEEGERDGGRRRGEERGSGGRVGGTRC